MAEEKSGGVAPGFVTAVLPWLVGAGGLLLYLVTLNPWVSLFSLAKVLGVSQPSWQPDQGQPLSHLLLCVFRCLPAAWVPLALNLSAAACAGIVLGLLARSVALLPQDLAPDDPLRQRTGAGLLSTPTAWLAPVLAALLCGLQLTFWEHATSFTGEMLDLVIFACVIWCLLEFRVGQQQAWLSRCALIYGVGMAENWAMVGYLPVFLLVLLRIKGLGPFLDRRFLLRMTLWGLAGLSFYLLLPALQGLFLHDQPGFWAALKAHLKSQKTALGSLRNPAFRMLALASLLPLLVLSIRWKSHTIQFGDDTRLGVFLTKATGHFVHGLFLVLTLWLALDPTFSPRHLGLGMPMLTYHYISALIAGYCVGYFLVFGVRRAPLAEERWRAAASVSDGGKEIRQGGFWARFMLKRPKGRAPSAAVGAVWLLVCLVPIALVWRNLGQLRMTNGPALRQFARQLYGDLPGGNSVVLSEEPVLLSLLQAELTAHDHGKEPLALDARALVSARYHILMAQRFKSRWPAPPPTNALAVAGPLVLEDLVSRFAAKEPVVYLHPDFGLFFEHFNDLPNGFSHRLVPPASKGVGSQQGPEAQTLEAGVAAANEQLWQQRWTNTLLRLKEHTAAQPSPCPLWARPLLSPLRLAPQHNVTASFLGAAYSKSLNYWGVQMQRLGHWSEAGVWFHRALDLNPNNLAARINAEYNQRCQQGDKTRLDPALPRQLFPEPLARPADWRQVLREGGPLDEPTFLFRIARLLEDGGFFRQAAREFARCAELAPSWPVPKLGLARNRLRQGDFSNALELTDTLLTSSPPQAPAGRADLLYYRTSALRGLGRTNDAAACLEKFVSQYWQESPVLLTAADLEAQNARWEPELSLLDELLKREPKQPQLLTKKGAAQLQLSQYDAAIATLSQALALSPTQSEARLNRAIAHLRAEHLDAAREDYRELLKTPGQAQNAQFGLAGIAWRQQDTNAAIQGYQQYLSNGVPGSAQSTLAAERLEQLQRK